MNKIDVMKDIDELTDTYCVDCPIQKVLRASVGKSKAHRFCIESCSIGEKLQFLGNELIKLKD